MAHHLLQYNIFVSIHNILHYVESTQSSFQSTAYKIRAQQMQCLHTLIVSSYATYFLLGYVTKCGRVESLDPTVTRYCIPQAMKPGRPLSTHPIVMHLFKYFCKGVYGFFYNFFLSHGGKATLD